MKHTGIEGSYYRFYKDMNFDRAGLFELIKEGYGCKTVLYPASSIHITPSFYFQHVVYVDISEAARKFFTENQDILKLVNSNKKYKQPAYIQFINSDYTKELPLRENNYDLLLSIFGGGISEACIKYIKAGGIMVSNNHRNDALQALGDSSVKLEAIIRRRGKKYYIESDTDEKLVKVLQNYSMPQKSMKNSSRGMVYVDKEYYFVFRKKL